jgi:2-haloalkanoic acid dehalogenase type II
MIRALFFDAFRTLFDSYQTHEDATRKIVEYHGLDVDPDAFHAKWDEFILAGWKDGDFILQWPMFELCLGQTFEFFGVSKYDTKKGISFWLDLVAGAPVFPETLPVLESLATRYQLAIVSNTDNFEIGMCLKNHPLPLAKVITSEDSRCYKPNTKIFDDALNAFGISAGEAVHIGDSQFADVLGASNAGIRSIWINRPGKELRSDLPTPDAELPDLTGVLETVLGFDA